MLNMAVDSGISFARKHMISVLASDAVQESRIFVEISKSRPTRARLRNRELADEAELVSLSVG